MYVFIIYVFKYYYMVSAVNIRPDAKALPMIRLPIKIVFCYLLFIEITIYVILYVINIILSVINIILYGINIILCVIICVIMVNPYIMTSVCI